jgi:hypothetical protein
MGKEGCNGAGTGPATAQLGGMPHAMGTTWTGPAAPDMGAYGYTRFPSGYPAGPPQAPPFAGPHPAFAAAMTAQAHGQMPGGPPPYSTFGFQGQPLGTMGPQGMHPGMTGPQGMPGVGHPFAHPGPQVAGPAATPMGYHQPQAFGPVTGQDPHGCQHDAAHGPGHPKHDAHQYGQFVGLVNELANGNADPSKVMAFLGSLDNQFWKGALVGVSITLLLTNDAIKNAIVGTLSNILGAFTKETPAAQSK